MTNNLVQFRVDEDIKLQATIICNKLGIDLSSYLRMCLNRLVSEKGIPFSMQIQEDEDSGLQALKRSQKLAEANGLSDMSLDEINQEIAEAREAENR